MSGDQEEHCKVDPLVATDCVGSAVHKETVG